MKEFNTWAKDLADSLSKKLDADLIPGLELTPWVGNRQEKKFKLKPPTPSVHDVTGASQDFIDEVWWDDDEGEWACHCQSCGESAPIYCDPSEFVYDNHYCGRSDRCCP